MSYHLIDSSGILGQRTVDLNSTVDQIIAIPSSKYVVRAVLITNASVDMTLSLTAGGIYTAVSKGGTALVGAAQTYTPLSASTKFTELSLAGVLATDIRTESALYFSLTVAHGTAATADLYIIADKLN